MKKFLIFLIFLTLGCNFSPFELKPIITGIVIWDENVALKYYNETPKTLYRSIKIALKELNLTIKEENINFIVLNSKINIKIDKFKSFTFVEISGDFPDQSFIESIFNQIDLNLSSIEYDNQGNPTKRFRLRQIN